MTATISISVSEYEQMQKDLKQYEELLSFYEAKKDAEEAKKSGKIKELHSLADLME